MRSCGPLLVGLWARETRACAGEVAWRRSAPHGMLGADLAIARRSRVRPPRTPRPPGDATGRSRRPVRRGARAGPGRHGDRIPRRGREGPQLTKTGTVIGTPVYMSPEQATGNPDIDGRSDEYSLACVTYEMLVGMPPFTGTTAQAVMARHSLDSVSPPSIVRATIPETVEQAILRALAKVPADRFATTALFAEALAAPGAPVGARRLPRAAAGPGWVGVPG